jgi:hypothetical protein
MSEERLVITYMSEERMVILVTGDRNWTKAHSDVVLEVLQDFQDENPIVVHGAAKGVDLLAARIAEGLGYEVHPHPAQWDKYHKAAGPIRNREMLEENPNLVFAFHDDIVASKGTRNMVNQAVEAGIHTILVTSDGRRKHIKARL